MMFRFPKSAVNWEELTKFTNVKGDLYLDFKKVGDYITMDLCLNEEDGGGWMEEEDCLIDSLIPLKEEILNGDFRSLFMGWLIVQEQGHFWDENEGEEIMIPQKQQLWTEVEFFLLRSTSKSYDGATEILCQLKEVAEYEKEQSLFQ